MSNTRKVKNFLVLPGFQVRISLYFMVSSLAMVGLMIALIFSQMNSIRGVIAEAAFSTNVEIMIQGFLANITFIALFFFILTAVFSFIFAVVISHSIAGPMYAICAVLDDMKNGQYKIQRKLRPNDELVPIMESVAELSRELDKKYGQ